MHLQADPIVGHQFGGVQAVGRQKRGLVFEKAKFFCKTNGASATIATETLTGVGIVKHHFEIGCAMVLNED